MLSGSTKRSSRVMPRCRAVSGGEAHDVKRMERGGRYGVGKSPDATQRKDMTVRLTTTIAAVALMGASPLAAGEFDSALHAYQKEINTWVADPVLVDAILAQNARTSGLSQDDIDALDSAWRAEVGQTDTPTIVPVLSGAAADFLRTQVAASGGRITEIFIMDGRGLNVAASDVTSDYWQGDEAKFTDTYDVGPGSVHFSEVEFDESTQRYQSQISMTIADPATGQAIGAVTVGVDVEALM